MARPTVAKLQDEVLSLLPLYLYRDGRFTAATLESLGYLLDLEPGHLRKILMHRFLHAPEVTDFVDSLHAATYDLERTVHLQTEEVLGRVSGHIQWGASIRLQASRGWLPYYVVLNRQRSYDTPANRLLRFVLSVLHEFGLSLQQESAAEDSPFNFSFMLSQTESMLRHPLLSEVSNLMWVPWEYANIAFDSPSRLYQSAATVYHLYHRLFIDGDLSVIEADLLKRVLAPSEGDTLYEVWALLHIIKALTELGASEWRFRTLSTFTPSWFCQCKVGDTAVRIYFQHMPNALAESSRYRDYSRRLGIEHARSRLPDIIVVTKTPSTGPAYRFIEVKWTDSREYIAESLYKAMGYLYDFESAVAPYLPAMLLVGDNVSPVFRDTKEPLWTTTSDSYPEGIMTWLSSIFSIQHN